MNTELLTKYMVGEAEGAEKTLVEQWLQESAEHQKQLNDLLLVWEASKAPVLPSQPNVDEAWERFLQKAERQDVAMKPTMLTFAAHHWQKMAAVALVALAGTWFYLFASEGEGDMLVLTTQEEVQVNTLPDGSKITLNKNTSLAYREAEDSQLREVDMKQGETFFEVTPNKSKPFVVAVSGITITVVGTSFNVTSNDSLTEIIVETGTVKVATNSNQEMELHRHEKAVIRHAVLYKETNEDELYRFYRSRELIANATPLRRIVDVLNQHYQTQIMLENQQLEQLELTATFRQTSLQDILAVICETFDLETAQHGTRITLRRKDEPSR